MIDLEKKERAPVSDVAGQFSINVTLSLSAVKSPLEVIVTLAHLSPTNAGEVVDMVSVHPFFQNVLP